MTTNQSVSVAETTTRSLRSAVEAADLEGFVDTLAPDVVFKSPLTFSTEFRGHGEVRDLMRVVFATIGDIRYFEEVGTESTRALFSRGRVGTQPIEETTLLRLDAHGKVSEITMYVRPLPGLTTLMAALGPRVARRRGRALSIAVRGMTAPLAFLTRVGDRVAARVAKP